MKHALRRYLFIGAMISLLLVVTACSAAPSEQSLNGTSWNLVKLYGQTLPAGTRPLTLKFETPTEISGNSGCNSYGGSYTASGSALAFNKVFSTLMACADQGVNNRETAFQQALSKVAFFEISNGQLSLKDASGAVVLIFSQA